MASANKTNAIYYPVNSPVVTLRYGVPYREQYSFTGPHYWSEQLCIGCFNLIKKILQDFSNTTYDSETFMNKYYDSIAKNCIKQLLIHPAVDIRANGGTDIRSVAWGKVTKVQDTGSSGFNTYIEIEHKINCKGNIQTFWARYCHLPIGNVRKKAVKVSVGDTVYAGQVLSSGVHTAASASSSAPHLHFEVHTKANASLGLWTIGNFPYINLIKYFLGINFRDQADSYFAALVSGSSPIGNFFNNTSISNVILQTSNIPGEGANENTDNTIMRMLLTENNKTYIQYSIINYFFQIVGNTRLINANKYLAASVPSEYNGVGFPSEYVNPLATLSQLSQSAFGTAVSNGPQSVSYN